MRRPQHRAGAIFGKLRFTHMTTRDIPAADSEQRVARHLMVIDGQPVESVDGRFIDVENPANRTTVGQVPRATEADVDAAVLNAAAAFEYWRVVAPRERGRLLSKIADSVEAELESLSRTVALE